MTGNYFECNTLEEVYAATEHLDVATEEPFFLYNGNAYEQISNFKCIKNQTQGIHCASVSENYNLVQHKEYFNAFATALSRLNIPYKATIQSAGNKAFADFNFINDKAKFTELNEEFTTGIRLTNSYNKSCGVNVAPRYTRLACTNGMILTRTEQSVSVRHNSTILKDIESFVEKRISNIINEHKDLQVMVSESMLDSIEWSVACNILKTTFKQAVHREEILKRLGLSEISVTDTKTNKKQYSYVWNDETQKKPSFTRWDIYNAITNYITFGEQLTPLVEANLHKKAERLLTTPLEQMATVETLK